MREEEGVGRQHGCTSVRPSPTARPSMRLQMLIDKTDQMMDMMQEQEQMGAVEQQLQPLLPVTTLNALPLIGGRRTT